jgi:4,4'-diaponeurosporenoate glycosyltransferase
VSGATATLLVIGWGLGWLLAGRRRVLAEGQPAAGVRVSVVVPARDEASRLPGLLAALAAATPPPHEVVVVDDGSRDGTSAVARAGGATVLTATAAPRGANGKALACQRGADAAEGDVLVFLDADVEPDPPFVASLAAAALEGAGVVSAHPTHRVERPYEHLSAGPAVVALLGAGTGGPPRRRWWRRPFAFGPALAVPADAYRRLGGHAAVSGAVIDDVAIAAAADRQGVAVTGLLAGSMATYRMYPDGLAGLVEGWTKNLAVGGAAAPALRTAAVAVWVTAALRSGLDLAAAAGAVGPAGEGGGWRLALPAIAYLLFAVQFHAISRRIGRFGPVTTALFPVILGAFVVLFAWSAALAYGRGKVRWRGRTVDVRRAR